MKLFMCLVVLAVAAVNAIEEEALASLAGQESKSSPLIVPSPQPLRPKPTLAPYKPITLKTVKPVQPTYAPLTIKPKVAVLPSTQRPLRPKPTLAAYKPIPAVIKPVQTTYKPLKVVPTVPRKNIIKPSLSQNADQSGQYVPWSSSA